MKHRNVVQLRADMIRCLGTRGGIMAAHLLSKALKAENPADWVVVSYDDWWREAGLTGRGVRRARGMLKSLGVITDGLDNDPPTDAYKIDWPRLKTLMDVSEEAFGDPPTEPDWPTFAPITKRLDGKVEEWQLRVLARAEAKR
jgi:hypothetical protein